MKVYFVVYLSAGQQVMTANAKASTANHSKFCLVWNAFILAVIDFMESCLLKHAKTSI